MKKMRHLSRQKQLPFEGTEIWSRLPEEVRERVIQILAEILQAHLAQAEARIDE
jgi:hypothetical protein